MDVFHQRLEQVYSLSMQRFLVDFLFLASKAKSSVFINILSASFAYDIKFSYNQNDVFIPDFTCPHETWDAFLDWE